MTGLDTNVLLRYIAQDDPKQAAPAAVSAHQPQACPMLRTTHLPALVK